MKTGFNLKKAIAYITAVVLILSSINIVFADEAATRGEVVEMLLTAADDYNPQVQKSDVIKGYGDGDLREDKAVSRVEALVMLKRAFGELPKPVGHNARVAFPSDEFTDIPEWAKPELENVFGAGIVAGTSKGVFSPYENVTKEQMELFIQRVFALFGANEKDDFYSTVNKVSLDNSELKPGRAATGLMYEIREDGINKTEEIIKELLSSPREKGTPEQKIVDFYLCVRDKEGRDRAGYEPIKPYIELIDNAKNVDELIDAQSAILKETDCYQFMYFGLSLDKKDVTRYIPTFRAAYPEMDKSFYAEEDGERKQLYLDYIKDRLALIDNKAAATPEELFEFDKALSLKMLDPEQYSDVDLTYNIYSFEQLADMFGIDMEKVYADSELKKEDGILVADEEFVKEFAQRFTNDNLNVLKERAKLSLIIDFGEMLSSDFKEVNEKFKRDFWGVEGSYTDEEIAFTAVQNLMSEYIEKLYIEKYFSPDIKDEVTRMIEDMIDVYRERIKNLDWMSETTKAFAVKKLDTMAIQVGYPDEWKDTLKNVEIRSPEEGGSYFKNFTAITDAYTKDNIAKQGTKADRSEWGIPVYTVNAAYSQNTNAIIFPAGILQKPFYDPSRSYEYNLGMIGFIIAHEITHAFDNNGAKYDENGNAADWWTKEDREAFDRLCDGMIALYDGYEYAPGIPTNGKLTLSENVADQGAISCVITIISKLDEPDYEEFFRTVATPLYATMLREYAESQCKNNVHSFGRARMNPVFFNCPEFIETFGIKEGDGMYMAPEKRVRIW